MNVRDHWCINHVINFRFTINFVSGIWFRYLKFWSCKRWLDIDKVQTLWIFLYFKTFSECWLIWAKQTSLRFWCLSIWIRSTVHGWIFLCNLSIYTNLLFIQILHLIGFTTVLLFTPLLNPLRNGFLTFFQLIPTYWFRPLLSEFWEWILCCLHSPKIGVARLSFIESLHQFKNSQLLTSDSSLTGDVKSGWQNSF